MAQSEKEVSRLQTLIDQRYCQLDTRRKSLMDAVRIIARNIFYEALQVFREMYDNYRDDSSALQPCCFSQPHSRTRPACFRPRQSVRHALPNYAICASPARRRGYLSPTYQPGAIPNARWINKNNPLRIEPKNEQIICD